MDSLSFSIQPEHLIGSIVSLLAFGVMAVYRGWMVPGKTVDRLLKGKDDVINQQERTIGQLLEVQQPLLKLLEVLNEQAAEKVAKPSAEDSA